MGLIICEKHGRCGIVHVCLHIIAQLNKNTNNLVVHPIKETPTNENPESLKYVQTFYLCKDCAQIYGNPFNPEKYSDVELKKLTELLGAVCGSCWKEYLQLGQVTHTYFPVAGV